MELAPVAGTAAHTGVGHPDQHTQPQAARRVRGIIIVAGKLTIGFVIGIIAIPALIASALIASAVVSATGGAQLIKHVTRQSGK